MKGGTFLAYEAMRRIVEAGETTPLPVSFLFVPDEEVGTPSDTGADRGRGQAQPPGAWSPSQPRRAQT